MTDGRARGRRIAVHEIGEMNVNTRYTRILYHNKRQSQGQNTTTAIIVIEVIGIEALHNVIPREYTFLNYIHFNNYYSFIIWNYCFSQSRRFSYGNGPYRSTSPDSRRRQQQNDMGRPRGGKWHRVKELAIAKKKCQQYEQQLQKLRVAQKTFVSGIAKGFEAIATFSTYLH